MPAAKESIVAVCESAPMRRVMEQARRAAAVDSTLVLHGETGTGKEVLARFVHHHSRRSGGPFVVADCATLSEHLFESEVFGHEKGAFTGALTCHPGLLEQAAGGTLLLDELENMQPRHQASLLRVVESKEFRRVGGTDVRRFDARFILASNVSLDVLRDKGRLRDDFHYRVRSIVISIPPLRERIEDIAPLARALLPDIAEGSPVCIAPDALRALEAHAWPGNVRELQRQLEAAWSRAKPKLVLKLEHFEDELLPAATSETCIPYREWREEQDREYFTRALARRTGNIDQTALDVHLARTSLRSMLERLKIEPVRGTPARPVALIVDDVGPARRAMARALRRVFCVREAGSCEDAIDAARGRAPQLLVPNYALADGNGIELVEALKHEGVRPPVVLVSAFPKSERVRAAIANGEVAAFLEKPFDDDALLAAALLAHEQTKGAP